MTVETRIERGRLIAAVGGRLDTVTAPKLEKILKESMSGIRDLIFDFAELEYISSAGLRVLLTAYKEVKERGGKTVVVKANEEVRRILFITGFSDMMKVE